MLAKIQWFDVQVFWFHYVDDTPCFYHLLSS
jgi:hypothetical protein